MAASGFTPISLYYSTTAAAVPTSGNLANGELALNIADMKLYAKNSAGVVTLLASNAATSGVSSFSAGTTGFTPSTATTGAVTLAGTLNVANGGTGLTTLTSGRIPYGNGTSALANGSNFTFVGNDLVLNPGTGSGASAFVYVGAADTTGTAGIRFIRSSTSVQMGKIDYDFSINTMLFRANGGDQMYLTSTGLGIGTSSVGERLVVSGNASVDVYKLRSNTSAPASTDAFIYRPADNTLAFGVASAENMRLTTSGSGNGNLLVGTTSSAFSAGGRGVIEVAGSGTALVSIKAGSANAYIYNDGSTLNIQNNSVGVLQLSTNSALRFQIGAAGQLGIGGATYGTAGQVLTSGGSGAAPTWATAAAGGTTMLFAAFSSTGESLFAGQGF